MSYSNSAVPRPDEAGSGGRGIYCCVPMCGSSQYDNHKTKTNIALFSFPNKDKRPEVYKAWCNEIYKYRRKWGIDNFHITKYTKICEFHFKPEEIKVSLGRGIKTLKTGQKIPSVFTFKETKCTKTRKSPTKRLMISPNTNEDFEMDIDMAIDTVPPLFENVLDENGSCEMCKDNRFQIRLLENKLEISEQKIQGLQEQNQNLEKQNYHLARRLFTVDNYLKDDNLFKSATGIEKEKFRILYDYLDPGEDCENIKYYEKSKTFIPNCRIKTWT